MRDLAAALEAKVLRAVQAVVEHQRRPGDAALRGVAHVRAVAEHAIVAECVVGAVLHAAAGLVAGVHGAAHGVVQGRGRARPAVPHGIADFGAVAEQTIVAGGVVRGLFHERGGLVAAAHGAAHAVLQGGRRAGPAALDGMTRLEPVAEQTIAAPRVDRGVGHRAGDLAAGVHGAGHGVVHHRRRSAAAQAGLHVAGLAAVAEHTVVAVVVALAGGQGGAARDGVAQLAGRARAVIGHGRARAGGVVAQVDRAGEVVATGHRRAGAALTFHAVLDAVAGQVVVTLRGVDAAERHHAAEFGIADLVRGAGGVVGQDHTHVALLVAQVLRAGVEVRAGRVGVDHAGAVRAALRSVAEEAVLAVGIGGAVGDACVRCGGGVRAARAARAPRALVTPAGVRRTYVAEEQRVDEGHGVRRRGGRGVPGARIHQRAAGVGLAALAADARAGPRRRGVAAGEAEQDGRKDGGAGKGRDEVAHGVPPSGRRPVCAKRGARRHGADARNRQLEALVYRLSA
jgi:hypothetical protein